MVRLWQGTRCAAANSGVPGNCQAPSAFEDMRGFEPSPPRVQDLRSLRRLQVDGDSLGSRKSTSTKMLFNLINTGAKVTEHCTGGTVFGAQCRTVEICSRKRRKRLLSFESASGKSAFCSGTSSPSRSVQCSSSTCWRCRATREDTGMNSVIRA